MVSSLLGRLKARSERKKTESPDYIAPSEKLSDYSKCFKDTVKKAFRIEGPCISACETGELGTMPLGQHMFPGSGLGQTAIGVGGGAALGLGFALMEMLGERAMEEKEEGEHGHEHGHEHEEAADTLRNKNAYTTKYINPTGSKYALTRSPIPSLKDYDVDELIDTMNEVERLEKLESPSRYKKFKEAMKNFGRQFKLAGKAVKEGTKYTYRMARGSKEDRRKLKSEILSDGATALTGELFGCIGASEITEAVLGTLLAGSLSYTNPLFWAAWGGSLIPAYIAGSAVVAGKLAYKEYKEQKTVESLNMPEGKMDELYSLAEKLDYKELNWLEDGQTFSTKLPDGRTAYAYRRTAVKGEVRDDLREKHYKEAFKDSYRKVATFPFRVLNCDRDFVDFYVPSLRYKDVRKEKDEKFLSPLVEAAKKELGAKDYHRHAH